MITINVRTKEVRNAREHEPPQYNQFGECSPGYIRGWIPPRYPMPALWDTYPDAEYLVMMYELDALNKLRDRLAHLAMRLRDLNSETVQ